MADCSVLDNDSSYTLHTTRQLSKITFNSAEAYALNEYGSKLWKLQILPDDAADERALGLVKTLKDLGSGYEKLLVDPGLMQHLDAFVKFVRANHFTDPWVARDQFGVRGVPQIKVYRGMALTEKEYQEVNRVGILSEFFREFPTVAPEVKDDFYYSKVFINRWMGLDLWMSYRMSDFIPFISVSEYPEIASSMAQEYTQGGRTVHVFEMSVSALDLITIDDKNGIWPPRHDRTMVIGADGKESRKVAHDRKLESFIFWGIAPGKFKEIPPLPGAWYKNANAD